MHEEFEKDGLVVLALSSEEPDTVGAFMDAQGYSVRTSAGSTCSDAYGVDGIPATFLIDPTGKVLWSGHPAELSEKKIKEALRGATKPVTSSFLAVRPNVEEAALAAHPGLGKAASKLAGGHPAEARVQARTVLGDAAATPEAKQAAQTLVAQVDEHAKLLLEQAKKRTERLDLIAAVEVYEVLAKEFDGEPEGRSASEALGKFSTDEKLKGELAAATALERARASSAKLATSKRVDKLQDFIKKFPGTRAAARAKSLITALKASK